MNIYTKQKQTHRHRKQTCVCQGAGGGKDQEFGISRCKEALESPLDSKEIKPVNTKGNQP